MRVCVLCLVCLYRRRDSGGAQNVPSNTLLGMGTVFAWVSAMAGFVGLLVRWHESYLLRPDAGHIPVSNLYEVFILFLVITALMYLYYEGRFAVQKLGGFVFSFMAIVVGFVLWYSVSREAHAIQPLIPALQSWWMKIHVPANFIGYGAFCIAAMLGIAELLALRKEDAGKNHGCRTRKSLKKSCTKRLPSVSCSLLLPPFSAHCGQPMRGAAIGAGTRKKLGHSSFG